MNDLGPIRDRLLRRETLNAETLVSLLGEYDSLRGEAPGEASSAVAPVPMVQWLRDQGGDLSRYYQTLTLPVPATMTPPVLVSGLQALIDHHEALRLALSPTPGDSWALRLRPIGSVDARTCTRHIPCSDSGMALLDGRVATYVREAATRLSPAEGRMLEALWFDTGPKTAGRAVVLMHHLSVDAVSCAIVAQDLATAWEAAGRGETPHLTPAVTSFRAWADLLNARAVSPGARSAAGFWRRQLREPAPLIDGHPDARMGDDAIENLGCLNVVVPPAVSAALLSTAAARRRSVEEPLLTALAIVAAAWRHRRGQTGSTALLVALEGHGREELSPEMDLSRTVGWFTALFPVRLDPAAPFPGEQFWTPAYLERAAEQIHEQLRVPRARAAEYGVLRYLNPATARLLSRFDSPQVGFNYLGRRTAHDGGDDAWSLATATGQTIPLPYVFEICAMATTSRGESAIRSEWRWSRRFVADGDVRWLAEEWLATLQRLSTG